MRRLWAPAFALALAACRTGDAADAAPATLTIATPADADALLPPLVMTATGRAVTDNVFERLAEAPPGDTVATVGDAGWQPRLAASWRWRADSLALEFAIDPRARFHDGTPVRAADVAFTYRLVTDPALGSPTAGLLGNVDSITVADSLTAVAWFRRKTAERFYDVAYQLWILPRHLLDTIPPAQLRSHPLARRPVGSGRFRFVEWLPGERIVLDADTTHPRGRPAFGRVTWSITPDPSVAVAQVLAGEADLVENLRGPQVADVSGSTAARVVTYRSRTIAALLLQTRRARGPHPVFGDPRVRRAIGHALDVSAIGRNVFDTLGRPARGPLPQADGAPALPLDTARAAALLDSAGWRLDADGRRRKGGRPLEFAILVPSTSRPRIQIATLAQEALRGLGVTVAIEQLDMPAFIARLGERKFDAALQVFSNDPSPFGLREQWGGLAARTAGSSNYTGWSNPGVDAALDSAEVAAPAQASSLLARAVATIVEEAPGIFIVQPMSALGVSRRLEPVGLRDDGWWTHLADWRVAAPPR